MTVLKKTIVKPVGRPATIAPAPAPAMPAPVAQAVAMKEATVAAAATATTDAQEQFRKVFEDGMAQSRAAYEKMRVAAEGATGTLEASYSAASKGVNDINAKAIDAVKAHSEASLEHVKAVMAAKTVGEAIALQTAHARKQFETFAAQSKEFGELMQKVAADSFEPLKSGFAKGFAH